LSGYIFATKACVDNVKPSEYRTFGIPNLRNVEPSEYRTFGISTLRNTEPSEYRTFGISTHNHNVGQLNMSHRLSCCFNNATGQCPVVCPSHVDNDGTVARGVSSYRCPVVPSLFRPTG